MAMSDTAEYWNDVKSNYPYSGPNYYHIPNVDCGHRHLYEAKKLGDINCHSCLKLIKDGYVCNLPEGISESNSAKKRRLANERYIEEQEKLYGRCSCGCLRTVRVNSITKNKFLACTNYPKCKKTYSLK